jgi:hypothetical protein
MVGLVLTAGAADGNTSVAACNGPSGVAVDVSGSGVVYFAEYGGNHVRKLQPPAQQAVIATAPVCDGSWHHVAATLDGFGGAAVFVDGAPSVSAKNIWANTNNEAPTQLRIGGGLALAEPFAGALADVRVYNAALNASQVLALSLPPLPAFANAAMTPAAPTLGATAYTFSCVAGSAGAALTLTRSASDGSWSATGGALALPAGSSPLLAAGAVVCTLCPAGSYSGPGQVACTQCPNADPVRFPTGAENATVGADGPYICVSATPTPSQTPTPTPSMTSTATRTPSITPSPSPTWSITSTPSLCEFFPRSRAGLSSPASSSSFCAN